MGWLVPNAWAICRCEWQLAIPWAIYSLMCLRSSLDVFILPMPPFSTRMETYFSPWVLEQYTSLSYETLIQNPLVCPMPLCDKM